MSERKVLNKYYPSDFDPTKLPKLKLPKQRQYTVRIMTPFNMKCNTCGDYIAKAKKFNARKETIENESYLGLKIFRFYIKCPKCMSEITFKTNPETCDYDMEFGAHRNFDALRLAMLKEEKEKEEQEEELKLNPMKLLENRTKQSKDEMDELENLAQLKEENAKKQGVNVDQLIEDVQDKKEKKRLIEERIKAEEAEDEQIAREWMESAENFVTSNSKLITKNFFNKNDKSTNILSDENTRDTNSKKRKLEGLVSVKKKIQPIVKDKDTDDQNCNDKKPTFMSSLCGYSDSEDESS